MDTSTFCASLAKSTEPCLLDLQRVFDYYRRVKDRRHPQGVRYPLWFLLSVATLAKMAGMNHLVSIAEWARLRRRELCALLRFCRLSMPATSTWSRAFARAVNVKLLNRGLRKVLRPVEGRAPRGSLCVALDGKTLRGTIRVRESSGVHLLALYLPSEGLVLAQVEVRTKANEISAAPQVLRMADLRGMIVTGDAMFTQRDLSIQIVSAGGDYLWDVKNNQPALLQATQALFDELSTPGYGALGSDIDIAESTQKANGRLEKRILWSSGLLQGYSDWPHLAQVFKLQTISTRLATGETTTTQRYGVTSLPRQLADARRMLYLVRQHWGIECGLHYRRDVDFQEDQSHCRMGEAPHLNATLNNTALALLNRMAATSIPSARRQLDYHIQRLLHRASPV